MTELKAPTSLRWGTGFKAHAALKRSWIPQKFSSTACVLAAGSVTAAEAQQAAAPLSPVTVDAPVVRQRPTVAQPTKAQLKARAALRPGRFARRSRRKPRQYRERPAVFQPSRGFRAQILTPDPAAPYKVDRLSSSKFTEPVLNTPRSVTVFDERGSRRQERHVR